jgi:hypothetical protein
VGLPVVGAIVTVTVRDCAVVMDEAAGVTVTVGVASVGEVTMMVALPEVAL